MSDIASSLPIRSEADGADQRVQVKVVDKTSPGTQQMTVDTDSNAHVEMHGNDPAAVDRVVRLSERGAMTPDGVYDAANNTIPGNLGLIASSRNASPDDTTQTQRLTSITNSTKRLLDVAIHDENGDVFSASNPLPVTNVDSEGSEVNDYSTASAVAAAATSNHDYTVTAGKTLKLSGVKASGSGRMKIEVQVESGVGSNVFASKFVQFNSTAEPNMQIPILENIAVAAGVRVRVIRTNRDLLAQDLYSTICGHEIP